ncbi:GBS Bsp-like repeat-containing protein [Streptococcus dentiloxodontae]
MSTKYIFGFKKNKAYGLCGVALAGFLLTVCSGDVLADENSVNTADSSAIVSVSEKEQETSETSVNSDEVTATKEEKETAVSDAVANTSEAAQKSNSEIESVVTVASQNQADSSEMNKPVTSASSEAATKADVAATSAAENAVKEPVTEESEAAEVTTATVVGKTMTLRYNNTIAQNETIYFAVWTQNRDQDDLVWYRADEAGAAYIDLSKHKEYGIYNVHTYSSVSGQMIGRNAQTVTVAVPKVTVAATKNSNGNFTVSISGVDDSITDVQVPVWSDKNDQDDIKWYQASKQADGTYTVDVLTSNHKSDWGHYTAHVYGKSAITGTLIGLAASGFDNVDTRANAVINLTDYAENSKTFTITVDGSGDTKTVQSVSIAVWSEENGQDDLKWYFPAIRNNSASQQVSIVDHGDVSGNYTVHVYVGYSDGSATGTNLGTYKITKPADSNVTKADLTEKGIKVQLESNTVVDYTKVRFAVWSAENDQDDIKWYNASSDGSAVVPYSDHKGYGTYHIHTYLSESGGMKGLNTTTISIAQPSVKTAISKLNDYQYQVMVSDVPYYISSVSVPAWNTENDQDDIKWYSATKTDSTTWTATINLKNHDFKTGNYLAHVYGNSELQNNATIGLAGTDGFTVTNPVTPTKPEVSVISHDESKGLVTVLISETDTSARLKSVSLAAWSNADQSNIHWYTSSNISDGQVIITVNERYHNYIKGNYTIHAYVDTVDGNKIGYNLGQYSLQAKKSGSASQGNYDVFNKVIYLDAGHGGSDPGASYYGLQEKNLSLAMQNRLKSKLEAAGYTVITTRTSDAYVDLLERSRKANASESDIFISLHFNASSSSAAYGIETYYYQYYSEYQPSINGTYHNNATRLDMSSTLASAIQSNVVSVTGGKNNGVKRNTFAVLRETTAPAVLLELGYLSNATEANNISNAAYQEKLANGIVAGILQYYSTYS